MKAVQTTAWLLVLLCVSSAAQDTRQHEDTRGKTKIKLHEIHQQLKDRGIEIPGGERAYEGELVDLELEEQAYDYEVDHTDLANEDFLREYKRSGGKVIPEKIRGHLERAAERAGARRDGAGDGEDPLAWLERDATQRQIEREHRTFERLVERARRAGFAAFELQRVRQRLEALRDQQLELIEEKKAIVAQSAAQRAGRLGGDGDEDDDEALGAAAAAAAAGVGARLAGLRDRAAALTRERVEVEKEIKERARDKQQRARGGARGGGGGGGRGEGGGAGRPAAGGGGPASREEREELLRQRRAKKRAGELR